uniref:Uncharacterized protein n=1 Tax=Mantoniella antarctica TaxID=81844 RepID=A0A7S0SGK7_9CHLO|mmetsp:Transcript_22476/g.55626  ORF Transcript_22476/g.55626 Transcript_22476/m.55626 type:complete len:452 (+) Transcript_22476:93-1448(+)|eukprot:CAMPEP_0181362970 /NCGR_PEP_ID=MMETSP1106-20121128/8398_1 /TAXON_ID=81844 /ORGANISM="Mantoniella antarctica, Strain SL-175" /LENGTH=451 /DNA_ID=CAMNT_0023477175 /DNA_START=93 /DNA_END=1448 /DNA_ORIENTATION=-
MASDDAFQESLAFLQKTNAGGESVYDQLAKVVGKILDEKPGDAVDLLETSLLVKKTAYNPPDLLSIPVNPKNTATAVALKDLYSTPRPAINPATGEPVDVIPPNDFETENVMADAALYEAIGLGLGKSEMYGVMLALKKLGEDPDKKLATVRFFGKMLGTGGDYYVFESTMSDPGTETEVTEGEVPAEASGTGANLYTYWVCAFVGGPFTRLPDVTPSMVACGRRLKRFLTGSLSAEVSAYPPFPGKEAAFLRVQVGRIASATVVCPAGFFTLGEDGASLAKAEEFAAPPAEDMADLSRWGHRYAHIKTQGRCELYEPPPPEGEEEPATTEEPEVSPALLSSLELDSESAAVDWGAAVPGEPAWATCTSSNIPGVKHQVVGVRSLVWPGAFVAYAAGAFSNCYVGYGFKNAPFVPAPPPAVSAEYEGMLQESTELPLRPDEPPAEEDDPAE